MKENSKPRQFASDNYAGICPEALAAMAEANPGHEVSYGDDTWTAKASDLIRDVFETNCEVFFVFNGTSANSLSLASLCQSYHSILCHELRTSRPPSAARRSSLPTAPRSCCCRARTGRSIPPRSSAPSTSAPTSIIPNRACSA